MAVLTITKADGTTVTPPAPETISWGMMDLDGDQTGRAQDGSLFRDRITTKRKVEVAWLPLSASEMSTLLHAVEDIFFTLNYPDAYTGAMRSMICYVGDRTVPMLKYHEETGAWKWDGVSMSFTEQ